MKRIFDADSGRCGRISPDASVTTETTSSVRARFRFDFLLVLLSFCDDADDVLGRNVTPSVAGSGPPASSSVAAVSQPGVVRLPP